MTRTPTAAEQALDTALEAVRRARVATCAPDTPQAAHEAVLDAIAALECGLDVLQDLAAIGGTSTAVAEPRLPALTLEERIATTLATPLDADVFEPAPAITNLLRFNGLTGGTAYFLPRAGE